MTTRKTLTWRDYIASSSSLDLTPCVTKCAGLLLLSIEFRSSNHVGRSTANYAHGVLTSIPNSTQNEGLEVSRSRYDNLPKLQLNSRIKPLGHEGHVLIGLRNWREYNSFSRANRWIPIPRARGLHIRLLLCVCFNSSASLNEPLGTNKLR